MNSDDIIKAIKGAFPQLPEPRLWEKNNLKRLYFNKKEEANDYTFFIDIDNNMFSLRLKSGCIWHKDYPSQQSITNFLVTLKNGKETPALTINDGITTEFYELNPRKFENLYCYELKVDGEIHQVGGKLAYRLQNKFKNFWNFSDYTLVSDKLVEEKELNQVLSSLWSTEAETFKNLHKISYLPEKKPSTLSIANFITNYIKNRFGKKIQTLLDNYTQMIGKVGIKRELVIRGWVIADKPAISLSVKSHIYYKETMDIFLNSLQNQEDIIGLQVIDIEFKHRGNIHKITGSMKDHRDRLVKFPSRERIKKLISNAPDEELVLQIFGGYDYPASALFPIVNTKYSHLFNVNMVQLMSKLTLSPEFRADIEHKILAILGDFIVGNFGSELYPNLFKTGKDIGFTGMLRYNDNTCHHADSYVLTNLKKHGVYKVSERFQNNRGMRVVLLLGVMHDAYKPYWNKIQDELNKLGFHADLVNVVHLQNIDRVKVEEKVKLVMKEGCDVVLAFLPNKNQDRTYGIVKYALFQGNIIASQFIFKETLETRFKWALANLVLGILAKTENIPYVLAEPLGFADYLVGIDISREKKELLKGSMNYATVARFYAIDGTFEGYDIQEDKIEGETVPQIVLERIFAKSEFQGKTIMIHRDGFFRGNEINDLNEIGRNHNIKFRFVEVIKRNVPRIFKVSKGKYVNPERDQIFYFSNKEAIIINNIVKGNKTVNPLRIRVCDVQTNLDNAILSVMALRLMHFGTTKTPKLPVTISFSDRISGFVRKGITPPYKRGSIPWWY